MIENKLAGKLNLKVCPNRIFDRKNGSIICQKDDLFKLVEDCIECNLKSLKEK